MKALILAGGYATRLRPLSFAKPKLLFPIAGKPMLERTLNSLARSGVDSAILAVNFMADELKKHFGSRYRRIRIRYSLEEKPLGTGGPIRLAMRLLGSRDNFLAMNGDILFDAELSNMLERHRKEKPVATIALYKVSDASRFGLVSVDHQMRVSSFLEKPMGQEPVGGLINAGIYLMSPKVFDYIQPDRRISIEREVFPILAKEDRLQGYELKGYWTDVGTLNDYLEANFSVLNIESSGKAVVQKEAEVSSHAILNPPCLVMRKARVGENAMVGPFTIVGEGSVVEEEASVQKSVLFNDVHLGRASRVDRSIIADGSRISRNVMLGEGTVLGAGVSVSAALRLEGGVKVCPYKEVTENVMGPANIL